MNVSLTVLSSISCIFDVELFTYVKEQKAVLEFFVPREKRSFFYSSFFMLEMSKGGMTGFLLMVELEKTKIKWNIIKLREESLSSSNVLKISVGLGVFICKL